MSFFTVISRFTIPVAQTDEDAQAYIDAVGLSGDEADAINKIVRELKGLENDYNVSETDYWSDLTDAFVFHSGLNDGTTPIGLKDILSVTLNGAALDATSGIVCNSTDTPNVLLATTYTTGFSIVIDVFHGGNADAEYDTLFHLGPNTGALNSNSGIMLRAQASSSNACNIQVTGNSAGSFLVPTGGDAQKTVWVSISPSAGEWSFGNETNTIANPTFGPSDNNFAPEYLKFGYGNPFTTTVYYRPGSTNESRHRFAALLNRATTSAERDELVAILTHTP